MSMPGFTGRKLDPQIPALGAGPVSGFDQGGDGQPDQAADKGVINQKRSLVIADKEQNYWKEIKE